MGMVQRKGKYIRFACGSNNIDIDNIAEVARCIIDKIDRSINRSHLHSRVCSVV